jgi:uncharacterized protein
MSETLSNASGSTINLSGVKLSNGMHPAGFPPLTEDILQSIVQRIASQLPVEKIVLFGSYSSVYGSPTPDSDIDLLVIMETTKSLIDRILSVSRLLRPRPFPMDILVRTPQEMITLLESGDRFFQEIMAQGQVIYERKNRF